VFASLYTHPLEAAAIRALIRDRLALPGAPHMLLQLGPAHTTRATARRPPADLIEPGYLPRRRGPGMPSAASAGTAVSWHAVCLVHAVSWAHVLAPPGGWLAWAYSRA
jgi:hypothetical protein